MSAAGYNIGISARALSEKEGGVKRYVYTLIKNLIRLNKENKIYIIHTGKCNFFDSQKEIRSNIHNKIIFDYLFLPRETLRNKIDVMVFTKDVIPLSSYLFKTKKILIVHDVTYFIRELNTYTYIDNIYNNFFIPISIKKCDHIITVSQSSKNDLIKLFNIDEKKIDVIYTYLDTEKFHPITDKKILDGVRKKYNLINPFILYVGAIIPRKNLLTLLYSFDQIKNRIPHDLVFVGGKRWKSKEIFEYIEYTNHDGRIKLLGHLPDSELVEIYNAADVFVFPSLYEGLGIPVVEAMACGTPVITSNTSSLPEVVGDAGVLIDPHDVDGLAKAIYEVLMNEDLRKEMIRKGLDRAKLFNRDRCVKETLQIFKNICDNERNKK